MRHKNIEVGTRQRLPVRSSVSFAEDPAKTASPQHTPCPRALFRENSSVCLRDNRVVKNRNNRNSRTVSLRQADRQLRRSGSRRKSSGDRRRLGHISKQGNILLRFLLVEAA